MELTTFAQIHAARLAHAQTDKPRLALLDSEQEVKAVHRSEASFVLETTGVTYEKAGGGRRVFHKKVGGG